MRHGYGVCQSDELLYLFILNNQPPPMNIGPMSNLDKDISKKLVQMWVNFAHHANPSTVDDSFQWNAVDKKSIQ